MKVPSYSFGETIRQGRSPDTTSVFCHSDAHIQRLDVRECFHRGLRSENGRIELHTFMHWMCASKIPKFCNFGAKHPLAPMAFKHFTPNFERARTFTFVYVNILEVRGCAPPATPTFGCARRNGKRRTKLAPVADGPFEVVGADEHTVVVKIDENVKRVSRDRIELAPKPAEPVTQDTVQDTSGANAAPAPTGLASIIPRTQRDEDDLQGTWTRMGTRRRLPALPPGILVNNKSESEDRRTRTIADDLAVSTLNDSAIRFLDPDTGNISRVHQLTRLFKSVILRNAVDIEPKAPSKMKKLPLMKNLSLDIQLVMGENPRQRTQETWYDYVYPGNPVFVRWKSTSTTKSTAFAHVFTRHRVERGIRNPLTLDRKSRKSARQRRPSRTSLLLSVRVRALRKVLG